MKSSIDNKVYDLRLNRKITQEDLAKGVGVSRQTIIAIEKGNYTPSVELALKLSAFFNTTVENIFKITHEK